MASGGLVLSCLVVISLTLKAESNGDFIKIVCDKSHVIVQHDTDTLLNCSIQAAKETGIGDILAFQWKFNDTKVVYITPQDITEESENMAGYKFFLSSWGGANRNVSLLITNTKVAHSGKYECVVVTTNGDAKATVTVEVESKYSTPKIYSSPVKIMSDESFTLTCVSHGYPKGDIRWIVDDAPWKKPPEVKATTTSDGLCEMRSTLSFDPNSVFRKFVCEVYNAKGQKENHQEFNIEPQQGSSVGGGIKQPTQIVAPVVVIGSLIVGLLLLLLFCRRKRQREEPCNHVECGAMMEDVRKDP